MSHQILVNESLSLVISRLHGLVDDASLLSYFDELETLGPFEASFNFLLVLDPEAELKADTEVIKSVAKRPSMFASNALRVVLANQELAFGLSRIYVGNATKARDQYHMTRELAEAAEMLGLSEQSLATALSA